MNDECRMTNRVKRLIGDANHRWICLDVYHSLSLLSKEFPRRGKIRIAVGETHGRRPPFFRPTLKGSNIRIRMVQPLAGLGRFFQPVPWVSPTAIHIGLLSESQSCTRSDSKTPVDSYRSPGNPVCALSHKDGGAVRGDFALFIKDNLMIADFILDKSDSSFIILHSSFIIKV